MSAETLNTLIGLMDQVNIAEQMADTEAGQQELRIIGRDVKQGFMADWDSMQEWRDDIEEGLELIKPGPNTKDQPWEGAANFKTPLITEARIKFGDRASQILLSTAALVKASVVGRDDDGSKSDRAVRVQEAMNYQLVVENPSWVEEHDKMLYDVSTQGTIFKKTFFNPGLGHNVSDVIKYPNFAVPQSTTTVQNMRRFSHKLFFSPNEIEEFKRAGIWLDVDLQLGATENDDEESAPEDQITEFIEQQTQIDLDEDGYAEPYVVTIHSATSQVVRIASQYGVSDVFVRDDQGLSTTMDALFVVDEQTQQISMIDPDKNRTVVKINREQNLTMYGFQKDPEGKFLDVGWFHILGSYAHGINAITNQLLDAGTLANIQGGWLARGFRKKMGDIRTKPGAFIQTNLTAAEMQQGIRLFDIKEASPTLFRLNEQLQLSAQRLASTSDIVSAIGANAPAATTLALVQEQQESTGAVILRLYRAMTNEFKIWFRLDSQFMDPEQYQRIVDDPDADFLVDFNPLDLDVLPSANPANSSRIQRIQTAQASMGILAQVAETGGNPQPIVKDFLEVIGSTSVNEVYPELTPEQIAKAQAQQEEQRMIAEQERLITIQTTQDLGEAEVGKANAQMLRAQTKLAEAGKNAELTDAKISETQANTALKAEQAETESTKNATNIVGAELAIDKAKREAQRDAGKQ